MAQREIVANSQTGTVDGTTINNLRASMVAGAIVTASDVQTLINMYNTMIGHYHTYTDRYQEATFGNNGDRNLYEESKNTGAPISVSGSIGSINSSTTITAAKHNEIAYNSRVLQSHYHQIDDRTAI